MDVCKMYQGIRYTWLRTYNLDTTACGYVDEYNGAEVIKEETFVNETYQLLNLNAGEPGGEQELHVFYKVNNTVAVYINSRYA